MTIDTTLTEQDIAKRFGVGLRTVQRWRLTGEGPAYLKIGKGTIRYRLSDVRAYEDRNARGGEVPEHAKKAMRRAADCLAAVAGWSTAPEKAKPVIIDIRDHLRGLIGETA